MLFNSIVFFLFFAGFFAAYAALRRRIAAQNLLILFGSYIFYGWWDERFLILIAISTATDFLCGLGAAGKPIAKQNAAKAAALLIAVGLAATIPTFAASWPFLAGVIALIALATFVLRLIEPLNEARSRKICLFISVAVNLGLLAAFKYFGFFTESFAAAASSIGMQVNAPTMQIILPIGISFYTFQTLSYTIDIYRGDMKPTRKLINFAAYVSFFPQLVAGPIERARRLLPQFETQRQITSERLASGGLLFMWGLYKKAVIADNLAPIVNAAFLAPGETEPAMMLLGVIAFAFQIFCDFSGYSDMARGLARMMGFELMLNFNLPYFARTPSEFWRRWHISLSTWLRDYLYAPLGGNRKGAVLTYRNLIITMLLGGLWHGAAVTFIAWGAFHGVILAIYRAARIDAMLDAIKPAQASGAALHVSAWAVMTVLTLLGWILFRAESMGDAWLAMQGSALSISTGAFLTRLPLLPEWSIFLALIWPLAASQLFNRFWNKDLTRLANGIQRDSGVMQFARVNAFLLLSFAVFFLAAEGQQQFIYFDF